MTPGGFYQQYRSHIINHTARAGQTIEWNNNHVMAQDEPLGPTLEDHILFVVISLIDPRLIEHVRKHYQLKLRAEQRIMDVRSDIFLNIPRFLEEIENQQLNSIQPQFARMSMSGMTGSSNTATHLPTNYSATQPVQARGNNYKQSGAQTAQTQPSLSAIAPPPENFFRL